MEYKPTVHKLSNGATVILDPMDLETVAIKIRFKTGSRDETDENHGITHFCEHMLCKGTKKLPTRKELREYVENSGGVSNAMTSNRGIMLSGRIIAENTNVLLEVFSDMLQHSLFDPNKIEIERSVILDELRRGLGSNQRKFANLIDTNLFGYSVFQTLGNEENIKSFTREQMLDWLHKRLSGKNCIIGVSGRIDDENALLAKIQELFSFLPNHEVPTNQEIKYTPCDKFLFESSLKNVWINILFPYIRPSTYENIRDDMAEAMFRKYLIQELSEVLRQQNGLVYGLGGTSWGNEITGVRGIDTETSPENLERVVALIAQTSYRIYTQDKITEPVIQRFRNIHRLADADFLESSSRRRDVLVSHWEDFGKLYDYNHIIELDRGITADDVIRASHGFFDGPMSIMTFGAEYGNIDLRKIWIDNFK